MKKKILTLMLCCCLTVTGSACSSGGEVSSDTGGGNTGTTGSEDADTAAELHGYWLYNHTKGEPMKENFVTPLFGYCGYEGEYPITAESLDKCFSQYYAKTEAIDGIADNIASEYLAMYEINDRDYIDLTVVDGKTLKGTLQAFKENLDKIPEKLVEEDPDIEEVFIESIKKDVKYMDINIMLEDDAMLIGRLHISFDNNDPIKGFEDGDFRIEEGETGSSYVEVDKVEFRDLDMLDKLIEDNGEPEYYLASQELDSALNYERLNYYMVWKYPTYVVEVYVPESHNLDDDTYGMVQANTKYYGRKYYDENEKEYVEKNPIDL